MNYPLDRMRMKMWRMAAGDTYKMYITSGTVAVQDLRLLWDWSWWCMKTGKRLG